MPCGAIRLHRRFSETCSSTSNIKAAGPTETSVNTCQTTRRHIRGVHSSQHWNKNLTFHTACSVNRLFNDAASSFHYTALSGKIKKLQNIWKEAVMVRFDVDLLPRHLLKGRTRPKTNLSNASRPTGMNRGPSGHEGFATRTLSYGVWCRYWVWNVQKIRTHYVCILNAFFCH